MGFGPSPLLYVYSLRLPDGGGLTADSEYAEYFTGWRECGESQGAAAHSVWGVQPVSPWSGTQWQIPLCHGNSRSANTNCCQVEWPGTDCSRESEINPADLTWFCFMSVPFPGSLGLFGQCWGLCQTGQGEISQNWTMSGGAYERDSGGYHVMSWHVLAAGGTEVSRVRFDHILVLRCADFCDLLLFII